MKPRCPECGLIGTMLFDSQFQIDPPQAPAFPAHPEDPVPKNAGVTPYQRGYCRHCGIELRRLRSGAIEREPHEPH